MLGNLSCPTLLPSPCSSAKVLSGPICLNQIPTFYYSQILKALEEKIQAVPRISPTFYTILVSVVYILRRWATAWALTPQKMALCLKTGQSLSQYTFPCTFRWNLHSVTLIIYHIILENKINIIPPQKKHSIWERTQMLFIKHQHLFTLLCMNYTVKKQWSLL